MIREEIPDEEYIRMATDENGSIDVEQALMNMLSMEICASIESNIMREYNNYLRND